jgi:hypothetical protein
VPCYTTASSTKVPRRTAPRNPPTIPPPPSSSLRHQRLGDHWTKFFVEQSSFPVFVTIQPNFDRCSPRSSAAPSAGSFPNADKAWELLRPLFYQLDRLRTECPIPPYLRPDQRFQGIAVMEKHSTNAHIHLLLRCRDRLDQFSTAMFMLEMLDNVEKDRPDPHDNEWQRQAWDLIAAGRRWSKDPYWTRTSSVLKLLAPAGTAMVQMVRTSDDLERVCGYMTKTWYQSTHHLAARATIHAYDPVLDWKELREFHASVEDSKFARPYRIDPITGAVTLDLDKPIVWKSKGRVVR